MGCLIIQSSGSQPAVLLLLKGHLAKSRDIFGCHTGGSYWHLKGRGQ